MHQQKKVYMKAADVRPLAGLTAAGSRSSIVFACVRGLPKRSPVAHAFFFA